MSLSILILCFFAGLAGFVDSIVGGGGLIQLPILFIVYPAAAPSILMGTNKLASVGGTALAVVRFAMKIEIPWGAVIPASLVACLSSYLGAHAIALVNPSIFKPIILTILIAVAAFTYTRKNLGDSHCPKVEGRKAMWLGLLIGAVLGFYDGFVGPGTGSFLIFAFITIFGFSFLNASACSKVINLCTNLSPVVYFALNGNIMYEVAFPMMAANIFGSFLGTKLAFMRGNAFIRKLFLVVVAAVIARFAYDLL